jgi:hypothetical protein
MESPMNRIVARLGIALLVLLVLLFAGVVAARIYFTQYLQSEAFRTSLGEAAARSLHAESAEFAPLKFAGETVYDEDFRATRKDGGGFSALDAEQLRATFDWHGLLKHTVQIDEMALQRLTLEPPAGLATGSSTAENVDDGTASAAPLSEPHRGWTVDLRKVAINEVDWDWSKNPAGGVKGTALTLTPDGADAWVIDAQGGTVALAGWPSLDVDSANMRWQSPTLYISSADLRNGASRLNVAGSIETRKAVDLYVKLDGVDIEPVLTPDWRQRLTGRLTGTAHVEAPLGTGQAESSMAVSGSMALLNGQLTALPILDELGTFTHTERFRQLELTTASAGFSREAGRLVVNDLVVESEGLIRVEGGCTVVNGQIDGTFEVGLTPATLQWIPGSQEILFTDSRGGYRWTEMRLTGPVSHPKEDLTPRLIAGTGKALLKGAEGLEGTVRKTGEGVLNLLLH